MSEILPNNWIKTTVGEVSNRITKGSTPTSYGFSYKKDGIKFIKTENVDQNGNIHNIKTYIDEETNKFLKRSILKKNDILFSIAGTIGRVGIVKENDLPANTNQALAIIRSSWDLIDVRYLFYLLRSNYAQRQASGSIVGVGRANVSLTNISDFKIPLPPLPEQHHIVAKIEELFTRLDTGLEALKQVQAQLRRYRQSVLKAAVEGRLTAAWREQHKDELEPAKKLLDRIQSERKAKLGKKYKEPISVDTFDLPKLPEGWAWATWEQILSSDEGSFKRGPFGSSLKKSMFVESGYKVYEQYCPINDDCSFARYYITKEKFLEMKAFSVRENDFLISCSGTLGRITQVPKEYDEGIINQALLRVRINESVVTSPFFIKLFRSPYFQKQIFAQSTGTAIPNVKGVKELKAIPVPLPSLLDQRIIVSEIERLFSILDKSESTIEYELKRAQSLRQSILKRAFEGKLVPQDPNDEPASVLLRRIKAEKAKTKKSKQLEMF